MSPPRPSIARCSRRALLAILGAAAVSCRRDQPVDAGPPSASAEPPAPPDPPAVTPASATASVNLDPPPPRDPDRVTIRSIRFLAKEGGPQRATLVIPAFGAQNERFPLLVGLGGLGETRRGMEAGAAAWVKDYWLDRAMTRLRAPPLTAADFQGLVAPDRLAMINASLAARPFRGLVVACPFTPDLLAHRNLDNAGSFARFVATRLLPRVRAEAPVEDGRSATGIDGVSLGGRVSLLVALGQPDAFGAVGVMQGAFDQEDVAEISARIVRAMQRDPFRLRLVTSDKDFYRAQIAAIHEAIASAAHDYRVLPGPHDYPWNRGPGAIEMLLWHDRALRGEAPDL